MAELVLSGRVVDLILVLTALEALALIAYHRRTGRGVAPADLFTNLLAGIFLMLALRAALTGSGWRPIALCLAASLAAHVTDLSRRWRA